MSDNTIEVACAITEASRHLNFALDQFCAADVLTAYPQAQQIELQIQAALKQLQDLATSANEAAAPARDAAAPHATEHQHPNNGLLHAGRIQRNQMKLVNDTKAKAHPAAEPVTVAYATAGAINFAVPADVPLGRAFDDLSVLLSSALSAVESVAVNEMQAGDATPTWSAVHTLQLAYALVQGMHGGYIRHRKQVEK